MPKTIIGKGAEAVIYHKDDEVIKDRIKKTYRLEEIDEKLRRSRTRREAKILEKLEAIDFPAPGLIKTDRTSIVEMQHIKGKKIRDVLEKKDWKKLGKEIGKLIRQLHDAGIIHGDLTTHTKLST